MNHNSSSKPYIPYLPKMPDKIYGRENYVQNLTNRQENEWQFLFREIKDIPSPYSGDQDYDFSLISEYEWQNVTVPSSLIMQGFDIENNIEYYYRRKVKLPERNSSDRLILRFEGVYSNARVWVNHHFLKAHIGGFTAWDCDITNFSKEREITLIIGVTDVEGDKKGIWNPKGDTVSNAAWASYYAHCNIGGIIRDITLFALPQSYIARTHFSTSLSKKSAVVEAYIEAFSRSDDLDAELILEDENGSVLSEHTFSFEKLSSQAGNNAYELIPDEKWRRSHKKAFENDEKYKSLFVPCVCDHSANYGAKLTFTVDDPKLWDAEHPNLYTLKIVLAAGGKEQQVNIHKIGIRDITYGGAKNTDKNKLYINGNEIKLRGVCRHDVSHLYGRSLTKEDIYNEIITYKKHNINFIRTSHYPATEYMLQVCDEVGMYVEQENAACFKGANNFEIYNGPQEFLQSFAEMIESARNHTSVIIWSLANESDFEKTYAFRAEFDYVKQVDVTRPVIFSYPHLVRSKPLPYDIISKHYAKVSGNLGDKKLPLLHDEFAHVSCYNLERLQQDNSVRDFWGESIKKGWDSIFETDGALGCAIWAAVDDVFCLPPGMTKRHQSHSDGQYAGYGEWGCIFDSFKRLKPEAYLTMKAFTPVFLDESKTVFGKEIKLNVTNRFDHTDLSEIRMVVSDGERSIYDDHISSSVKPHKSGIISFKENGGNRYTVEFYQGDILVDRYNIHRPASCVETPSGSPCLDDCIKPISKQLICKKARYRILQKKTADRVDIKIVPLNLFALFAKPGDCVLSLELKEDVKSVSWARDTLYSLYPQEHIGRAEGTAYPCGRDNAYGIKPDTPWELDNENYFLYSKSCGKRRMSNDFFTKRNKIKYYSVHFATGRTLNIVKSKSDINAYVRPSKRDNNSFELQISAGCFYPDLKWGNYLGKRFVKLKDLCITFSLSCTEPEEGSMNREGQI